MNGCVVSECRPRVKKRTKTCWPGYHDMMVGIFTRRRPDGRRSRVAEWTPWMKKVRIWAVKRERR